ncbi:uncharacterized protein LOC130997543 [Salvia miltiorrhiza]|uniref:uncharacterized protein LOC130997543 n=1 Tax=Salvia miltiorrhiza TaxID=226208 RepID=UPI0025AB6BF0|nr:uncharacterized protein LOC130997543 [Salvia miltiorrhiza]
MNMEKKKKKHLSSIANHVIGTCAQKLDSSVDHLIQEFERGWKPEMDSYSKKLVEFCCTKALALLCGTIDETISNGSFSRFTFDMMLAWEMPSSTDEESHSESMAKEKEERKVPAVTNKIQDDVSIFYTDLMPLLVDREPSAGEDAFVWLGTLVPLVVDIVNGRFTYDTLTAPTANRLHFPAYDKFLKEIQRCIKHLQKQDTPAGVELADDEFILHVEGTASSNRVVRHIGGTSWPGRLTLTNYALYFEASGIVSYEDALKLDLSKDVQHSVKPTATGPWGAPLFDKAIVYESSELQEGVIIEFPEMTSATRRDHWFALVEEIMLLHQFLLKFKVKSELQVWELHARTILGIIRLHAAREMLRISPPEPKSFLIFSLLNELPKGDYILQELSDSVKTITGGNPCSASSILRNLNVSQPCIPCLEPKQITGDTGMVQPESLSLLEDAINQSREEAKEVDVAKASAEGIKEEGISESAQVLMGLLNPVGSLATRGQRVLQWERPMTTSILVLSSLIVIYKEWAGPAISALLLWMVATMLQVRRRRIPEKHNKIVICAGSDQSAMESIVTAQQGLRTVHETMKQTNIALLKIWSILTSEAPKHTNTVMVATSCCAAILAVIPFKYILMAGVVYGAVMTSKSGRSMQNEQGNRRLWEWWDSIPIIPVEIVDNQPASTSQRSD